MGLEFKGLDEAIESFERLGRNAEELSNHSEVEFGKLFTDEFVRKHTNLSGKEEFFDLFPDPDNEDELNKFAASISEYKDWESLLEESVTEYVENELFNGV